MVPVTAIVTAFERPGCLTTLLHSLEKYCPGVPVLVADSGREPTSLDGFQAEAIDVPRYCGVSVARNTMADAVRTPYLVVMEDDFVAVPETQLQRAVAVLDAHPDVDVVGGMVRARNGQPSHYEGLLETLDGVLRYSPGNHGTTAGLPVVDIIYNFFVARVTSVQTIGWDSHLKLAEHTDFFLRAKDRLRVVYDSGLQIGHQATNGNALYLHARARGIIYARYMLWKHGLSKAVGFKGQVVDAW